MRVLHFDIVSGIAGDMTLGALIHLGAPIEPLREALSAMGLGGVEVGSAKVSAGGIGAVRFEVGFESSDHEHRTWTEIRRLLDRAGLPDGARARAEDIFERLARAESTVHGQPPEEVCFHEVGAVDSIADITGCALALDYLNVDKTTSSTPLLGRGITRSQHGPIPVPAPATLELMKGLPTRGLDVEAELTTPTGAAILASQVDVFTGWPDMEIERIGYGCGTRRIEGRPNLLRAVVGKLKTDEPGGELLVAANIDDMSPEYFEPLVERLLENGAHDVWMQPVIMKKSRPAVTLSLLCDESQVEGLERILFEESTTIGVRRIAVTRRKLARRHEPVKTPYGTVRMKVSGDGDAVLTVSPEHDDCKSLAADNRVPLKEVYRAALEAWSRGEREK